MKAIRNNVFETNSSSTHTIIIPKEYREKEEMEPQKFKAHLEEFGWENDRKRNLLNYIYTGLIYIYGDDYKKYTNKIDKMLKPYNIEITWAEPKKDEWGYYSGYVDHGYELEKFYNDLFTDADLLVDAILNGYVNTGNDNDETGDEYLYGTIRIETYDEYRYYKGN